MVIPHSRISHSERSAFAISPKGRKVWQTGGISHPHPGCTTQTQTRSVRN